MINANNAEMNARSLFITDVVKNMKNKKLTNKKGRNVQIVDAARFIQTMNNNRKLLVATMGGDASVFAQYEGYVELFVLTGSGPNSANDVCDRFDLKGKANVIVIDPSELVGGINDLKTDREKKKEEAQLVSGKMKASYHKGMSSSGTIKRREAIDNKMNAHLEWIKRGEQGRMKWEEERSMLCFQFLAIIEMIKYSVNGGGYYTTKTDKKGDKIDLFIPFSDSEKAVFHNLMLVMDALRYEMIWTPSGIMNHQMIRRMANTILKTVADHLDVLSMGLGQFKTHNQAIDNRLEEDGLYGVMEMLVSLIRRCSNKGSTFRVEYAGQLHDNADHIDDMNPQELWELGYLNEDELPSKGQKVTDEMVEMIYFIARSRAEKEIQKDKQDLAEAIEAGKVAMELLNIA